MTTPTGDLDLTGYVDLSLYDVDVDELIARALARVAVRFPDWTPREGHIEVVLLEAVALEVQQLAYAVNRLPGTVVEVVLRLFELDRDPGRPPRVDVRFAVEAAGEVTIPAGTSVAVLLPGGVPPVTFRTDRDAVVPAGATTITVPAAATETTTTANTLTAGTPGVLLDPVTFVTGVTVTLTAPGADAETAEEFLDRGATRFRRLSTTLVRPEHYTAAAREVPEVERAFTLDRYNPAQSPPTGRRGHVTVAAAGAGGLPLPADVAQQLRASLLEQGHAGLDVHVVAPTITAVNVTATLTRLPGFTINEVDAAAREALAAYLNPDAWTFGGTVWRNELIPLLDRVPGVDLVTLTAPAGDVTLTGAAPLATLGTVTLTIT